MSNGKPDSSECAKDGCDNATATGQIFCDEHLSESAGRTERDDSE